MKFGYLLIELIDEKIKRLENKLYHEINIFYVRNNSCNLMYLYNFFCYDAL